MKKLVFKNSAGKVYYGMHFYPGVAEYRGEEGKDPYRVFINENTIRNMSPTFAGRPIFVEHVDEVEQDIDSLRNEADGWVVESFFNPADGKTWAKFIIVSDRGEKAIRNGFRLSNAYIPKAFGKGGLWNGVSYAKEVTDGEFEHLAIVRNPRYEESVIMTPEEFKEYNRDKELELTKLANSKDQKENPKMAFSLFKKQKVENSKDLDGMIVELPKSKREVPLETLVKNADEMAMNEGKEQMVNGDHMVELDGKKMSVNDLLAAHKKLNEDMKAMKDSAGSEEESEESMDNKEDSEKDESEEVVEEEKHENEEEEEKEKEEPKKPEVKKNSSEKKPAKAEGRKHFEALRNAHNESHEEVAKVDLMEDQVARGRTRYGS